VGERIRLLTASQLQAGNGCGSGGGGGFERSRETHTYMAWADKRSMRRHVKSKQEWRENRMRKKAIKQKVGGLPWISGPGGRLEVCMVRVMGNQDGPKSEDGA
jgi:hypothetical protein